ncbi:hypothetical protein Fmac_016053 [Flemingia macrophylla]|uniref:U1-type domain-containing protein n=1 Tax=Flemingia macrophylla TaxID=520843 RepID=A0ABD1MGB6_9FABA
MFRRFQNRCDWNDISFRGWSQRQFNYHDQVPHHGWDSCYSGYRFVPHQTSGPIIPAVAPLHQPLPETYCKICEVKLSSYKVVEQHNKGRRHQSMLNLHNETERQRISNGLIPNSQINLVDQSKTVLKSGKKECPVNNVSSEATFVKHENLLQKDVGVTSEVPVKGCEEKPGDNTGVQGHSFKHTISGAKTGKYMKTNEGVRRPMESSKLDVNSLSDSVETLIQVPSLPVETNDQLHAVADSNINNPPKDVSSDSAAIAIRSPQVLYCNICGVQLPNDISSLKIHTNGKRHQSMLKLHTKLQVLKTSSGQIPKIQKSLVVQSGEKECSLNYTSSETTIAKNNNYLQRVTSEIPAEGPERKPRDNSGVHGHNLKRKIGGDKTGKYMKTNDGVRRPMESSKQNFNSLSKSVESPVQNSKPTLASLPGPATSQILASTPVLGSEGKEDHKIQNPTAEMSDSKESKEHHEIQNFSMETNDQAQAISQDLHVQVGSDINAQNDVSSDAKEVTIVPAKGLTASHTSEGSPAAGSNFESQIQHVLRTDTELKLSKDTADCESQNCTDEKNNEPLPSVVVELNSPSGSSTNTQTADACFKVEQRMDILPNKSDITKLSQVFLIF